MMNIIDGETRVITAKNYDNENTSGTICRLAVIVYYSRGISVQYNTGYLVIQKRYNFELKKKKKIVLTEKYI